MLVSVYIRKQDEDKWRKLPKKTEAVSRLLNGTKLSEIIINENIQTVSKVLNEAPVTTESRFGIQDGKIKQFTCKHGVSPQFCKHAKLVNGKKVCK
jgi:hypothetical protein